MTGCIGTDIIDDPIVPERIEISPGNTSIPLGTSITLESEYFNRYGILEDVDIQYFNFNEEVITVDLEGNITTLMTGQAFVFSYYGDISSDTIQINVVGGPDDVASVVIEESPGFIDLGDMITLMAKVYNLDGAELVDKEITWRSNDPNIASITNDGVLTGISDGTTTIEAISEGVISQPFTIMVGNVIRTATFTGNAGYNGEGTVQMFMQGNDLIVELRQDFNTDFALGTFIYLSNTTSGSGTRSNGLELGEIFRQNLGSTITYNVSQIDSNVTLDQYRYVIVLCKPASITFAIADFEGS